MKETVVALCLIGVPEWLVKVVQATYQYQYQGSVLSPVLFIIVLEAISRKFCVGHPWKMLYAEDLVILAEMLEDLIIKMAVSKNGLESKGLKININKTKVITSGRNLHTLQVSGWTQSSAVVFVLVSENVFWYPKQTSSRFWF